MKEIKDLSTAPATTPSTTTSRPPVRPDHDLVVIDDDMIHFNQHSEATLLKAKTDQRRSLILEEVSCRLVNNAMKVWVCYHTHLLYFLFL